MFPRTRADAPAQEARAAVDDLVGPLASRGDRSLPGAVTRSVSAVAELHNLRKLAAHNSSGSLAIFAAVLFLPEGAVAKSQTIIVFVLSTILPVMVIGVMGTAAFTLGQIISERSH